MKIAGFWSGHDCAFCILENGLPVVHAEYEGRLKAEIAQALPSDITQTAAPPAPVVAPAPTDAAADLPSPQLVDPDPNAAPF